MQSDEAPMDASAAMQRIDVGLAYDAPLRRRAEGLSWMVWGLATAIVLLTYFSVVYDRTPHYRWWWMLGLAAWPALGLTSASSVWFLAGVARPPLSITLRRALLVLGVGILLSYLAHILTVSLPERYMGLGFVVIFSAVPWAILAAVQWERLSQGGRRATVFVGSLMFLIILVLDALDLPTDASISIVVATVAGIPFLGGLTWLLRR